MMASRCRGATLSFPHVEPFGETGDGSGGEQVRDYRVIYFQPVAYPRNSGSGNTESPPSAKKSSCTPTETWPVRPSTVAGAPDTVDGTSGSTYDSRNRMTHPGHRTKSALLPHCHEVGDNRCARFGDLVDLLRRAPHRIACSTISFESDSKSSRA